jgi:hypothetical protein
MGGSRYPFVGTGLLEPEPPVPISATHVPLSGTIIVTFDKPLAAGSTVDPAAWTGIIGSKDFVVSGGSVVGSVVTVNGSLGETVPGPNQVTYRVPPGVLLGDNGVTVAEFIAYPVTAP